MTKTNTTTNPQNIAKDSTKPDKPDSIKPVIKKLEAEVKKPFSHTCAFYNRRYSSYGLEEVVHKDRRVWLLAGNKYDDDDILRVYKIVNEKEESVSETEVAKSGQIYYVQSYPFRT